jgi:hypothetical protein
MHPAFQTEQEFCSNGSASVTRYNVPAHFRTDSILKRLPLQEEIKTFKKST